MRSKRLLKQLGLATVLGIAGVLAAPSLGLASCAAPPPFDEAIRDATAVFVGTVIGLHNRDRTATVEVHDVWKGGEIAAEVEVRGGVTQRNAFTTVDRTFELSRDYLFVPHGRDGSVFQDNACTRTTRFRAELNRFRPAGAVEPSPTATSPRPLGEVDEDDDGTRWLLVVGAGLLGAALIAIVLRRRKMS